jgi:aldehyde:ferredoxin oxidoreductase
MKGMNKKLLSVNLTTGSISQSDLSDDLLKQYVGGRGLAVRLFVDSIKKGADPLSEDNVMVFASGPLTGTMVPTAGRFAMVTKSPLTGGIVYCNAGGFMAPVFKRCGYDALMITGKASTKSYIVIDGSQCTVKDASQIWGLDTTEASNKLKEIEGKTSQILVIGPAGENLVRIAAIMSADHRAFGRGGVGAVMGSKNLKAIVMKNGKNPIEVHDPDLLKKYVQVAIDKIHVAPITNSALPLFGTTGLINVINEHGMLPIRNFQEGYSTEADNVSGETIKETILVKNSACFGCPIRCDRETRTDTMSGRGPEYETDWALGPNLGIFDLKTITEANYYCNLYGIDTISAGGTIACAMELNQLGVFPEKEMRFGNVGILKDLIRKIALKEGIGAELAEGSKRLSMKYGHPEVSMQVKGLELPAYDPRGAMGQALGFATANRGGCHLTGYLLAMEIMAAPKKIDRFTLGGKSDMLALKQNQSVMEDSLSVCKFVGWALGFDFMARFTTAVTGEDFTIAKLVENGERVYNLERMYNLREGIAASEDTLPERFLKTPLKEGASKNRVVPLKDMLIPYYQIRGWTKDGIPKDETLQRLGLTRLT